MSYFVQLNETNTTLNLAQIASVEWDSISPELEGTNYTTMVNLTNGGGYYITRNDAGALWRAMQRYNHFTQNGTFQNRGQQNVGGREERVKEARRQENVQQPPFGSENQR